MINGAGEGAERIAEHGRLLVNFLVHEVAVIALADQRTGKGRLGDRPLGGIAQRIEDLGAVGADDRPVPFLQILNAIGQIGERQGIRADIHLAVAIADRERAAAPGADQKIFVTFEQKGEREGSL